MTFYVQWLKLFISSGIKGRSSVRPPIFDQDRACRVEEQKHRTVAPPFLNEGPALDWIALSDDTITFDFFFFLISLTIYPIEEHILKPQDQKYGSRQKGGWML